MADRLQELRNELIKASRDWASGTGVDMDRVAAWRDEAAGLNHEHYFRTVPAYRKLAQEAGCDETADMAAIERNLMFSADIFKSYEPAWLDDGDFAAMTRWLSGLFHRRIEADVSGVNTIDEWIECLGGDGVHVVYSSGTSGAFSFVPRDAADWGLSRMANIACLAPLLARRIGGVLTGRLMQSAIRFLSPEAFAQLAADRGLPNFDAAFLGFRSGRMGNQALIEELAPLFRRHYFLYDMEITGTALRCLRRGCRTEAERQLVEALQAETAARKEENYLRLAADLRQSTGEGRKVFMFGAPYQFRQLCEVMAANGRRLRLKKGSVAMFGGGWKAFTGEAIGRGSLIELLTGALGLPPERVLEGYSMTEINALMLRCERGRFHIPPLIEPVVFDEELNPLEGADVTGAFGFLDPLAVSYPGFIISGDRISLTWQECGCGLAGPSVTDIGRLPGSEVKGCGGIMGSMEA
jgi:hypothetical protein